MPGGTRQRGMAMVEVLVALLVFSLALAGALEAQLRAFSSTRSTVAALRGLRLVADLAQREGVATLAAGAPVSLPLTEVPAVPGMTRSVARWFVAAAEPQVAPTAAVLCVERAGPVLRLSLAWPPPGESAVPGCGAAARRASMLVMGGGAP